jgi:flagellar hook-basal body complex protein FliE
MIEPAGMQNLLAQLSAARETMAHGLETRGASKAGGAAGAGGADFGAMLKSTIAQVDASQQQATALSDRFQMGDSKVSLEDTMVALSKANLSFQELVQVRNRVVSAYHDIMNLQI